MCGILLQGQVMAACAICNDFDLFLFIILRLVTTKLDGYYEYILLHLKSAYIFFPIKKEGLHDLFKYKFKYQDKHFIVYFKYINMLH